MLTVNRQFQSAFDDGGISFSRVITNLLIKGLGRCFPNDMVIIMSRSTPDSSHISDRVNGSGVFTEQILWIALLTAG